MLINENKIKQSEFQEYKYYSMIKNSIALCSFLILTFVIGIANTASAANSLGPTGCSIVDAIFSLIIAFLFIGSVWIFIVVICYSSAVPIIGTGIVINKIYDKIPKWLFFPICLFIFVSLLSIIDYYDYAPLTEPFKMLISMIKNGMDSSNGAVKIISIIFMIALTIIVFRILKLLLSIPVALVILIVLMPIVLMKWFLYKKAGRICFLICISIGAFICYINYNNEGRYAGSNFFTAKGLKKKSVIIAEFVKNDFPALIKYIRFENKKLWRNIFNKDDNIGPDSFSYKIKLPEFRGMHGHSFS